MKSIIKPESPLVDFCNVKVGDTFSSDNGNYGMKIQVVICNGAARNAVNYATGALFFISASEKVEPFPDATLVLNGKVG